MSTPTVVALAMLLTPAPAPPDLPVVLIDRDDVTVTTSCIIRTIDAPIPDVHDDGVLQIAGDGILVRFEDGALLRGAAPDAPGNALRGIGVRITGRDVTLEGARVAGFRVGIHALGAHRLAIAGADVSDNFRQRLGSTPDAEDGGDWLWPHANDANEWAEQYGAGVHIEDVDDPVIRDVVARRGQNGILLDRVHRARVHDNDCSFLSGWGLALWRSSQNVITRNAFDFCVRGYSHDRYNRGQDSAGILLFEQCSDNVIARNSATHCGDGIFIFAGREALGEEAPRDDPEWYRRLGCNRNLIVDNDLSWCVAHGIEVTFSFDNVIADNRIRGNAICGFWGGYSQDTLVSGNAFSENGGMAYGLEHGGINIEHGAGNRIRKNVFRRNRCAIHLWWDDDPDLLATPWARTNERGCTDNLILDNQSFSDEVFLRLRQTGGTTWLGGNIVSGAGTPLESDASSPTESASAQAADPVPSYADAGVREPVGARRHLAGRERIVMTSWGPYDWEEPMFVRAGEGVDEGGRPYVDYRLMGPEAARPSARPGPASTGWRALHTAGVHAAMNLETRAGSGVLGTLRLTAREPGVHSFVVDYRTPRAGVQSETRLLVWADWTVRHFVSPVDPRLDEAGWRSSGESVPAFRAPRLDQRWGSGGPGGDVPDDHFGTIATTTLTIPAGSWNLRTTSDDGIRVWIDDALVIDDWTWHPPTEHVWTWRQDEPRERTIRIEHFELDGHAVLSVALERAADG